MIVTCLTYLLCKYLLSALWYMPVLCWVTDIWDPPSDWLHTCPEYIFVPSDLPSPPPPCLVPWEADLYGLHQCALLHSGWVWSMRGIIHRSENRSKDRSEDRKEVNPPHCCSPQVLVISLTLCSCLLLLTYSLLFSSLSTFIQSSSASLREYGTCFLWDQTKLICHW